MKKFTVKFLRAFEVTVEADTLDAAKYLANRVIAEFPAGTTTMLSIIPEGYVAPVREEKAKTVHEERNAELARKVRAETAQWPGGIDDLDIA